MKRNPCPFLLVLLSLFLTGCGNHLQTRILGTWGLDEANDLFEMMGDENDASEHTPKFSLVFSRGGFFRSTVSASGHSQTKYGRWFFVECTDDLCKLRVSINSQNPDIDPDIVLTEIMFIDENTIELVPPNMDVIKQKMTFRRLD
ncbi:MAG: hypothetical protein VX438_00970 [Planctomycetota bacterium]|jgi:hypothetical protein|nr:hypothetical protein [Planctomycetota bacterium]